MYNYLTKESIKKLEDEIEYRKVVTRKAINGDLKEARAHGDLSENFEYKAAKRDRARNESRIRFLERMIKTSILIDDTTSEDQVGIGKTVYIKFEDDEIEKFLIVTTIDADPLENRISIESPLGKAIYKHRLNEKVQVHSPNGSYYVTINKIENQ
ncbi:transcription elongation factor GreA [Clostridium sp.]|uniref:transcription elongation factor GreA n=1 Tax=Clostridium sp. TaxID=1506 RepID=UPI003463ACC8